MEEAAGLGGLGRQRVGSGTDAERKRDDSGWGVGWKRGVFLLIRFRICQIHRQPPHPGQGLWSSVHKK